MNLFDKWDFYKIFNALKERFLLRDVQLYLRFIDGKIKKETLILTKIFIKKWKVI